MASFLLWDGAFLCLYVLLVALALDKRLDTLDRFVESHWTRWTTADFKHFIFFVAQNIAYLCTVNQTRHRLAGGAILVL